MEIHSDGDIRLFKFDSLGPYDNNAYIIADHASEEAYIVDMPAGSGFLLDTAKALRIKGILLTHTHPDHWAEYDRLKAETGARVFCHPAEQMMPAGKIDEKLSDDQELRAGGITIRALHTPGHTPGSTCFLAGRFLVAGDVLFPGGPGRTETPQDFKQSVQAIEERLLCLPETTLVLPGHGADTTIAESRREYAGFTLRQHPPDLCGDVTWLD